MEYTKGKWRVRQGILDKRQILITADDKVDIAIVRYEIKESKANAHLIAAAPCMYEALKGLMEIAKIAMPDTFFESDSRVNKARKALAKVKGG